MIEATQSALAQVAIAVALGVEFMMMLVIAIGTVRAMITVVKTLARGEGLAVGIRNVWLHYAAWILLALELALAADLIRTVVAPSWSDIGQLAAIAAIRTALAFFLGRDISEFRETKVG